MSLPKVTQYAHFLLEQYISPGDTVIDATCGNGYDTLYLARIVGPAGKVISFDIQREALVRAQQLLEGNDARNRVTFIHDSHENLNRYVNEKIKGITFNLGYLPGGDKSLTTQSSSTLRAIQDGLEVLQEKGIMTVCIYRGHPQGNEESRVVLDYVKQLDQKHYQVLLYEYINQKNAPPYLIVIHKH